MSLLEALRLRRPSGAAGGAEAGAEWPLLGDEPWTWADPYARVVWLVRTPRSPRTHAEGLDQGLRSLVCRGARRPLAPGDHLRLGVMARVDCRACRAHLGLDLYDLHPDLYDLHLERASGNDRPAGP